MENQDSLVDFVRIIRSHSLCSIEGARLITEVSVAGGVDQPKCGVFFGIIIPYVVFLPFFIIFLLLLQKIECLGISVALEVGRGSDFFKQLMTQARQLIQ